MNINNLTGQIIGAAIEVHKALGPGLLESAYEECLCHEFGLRRFSYDRQKPLSVEYKGVKLDCGYRLDLVVEKAVVLELKSCEKIEPIHKAQLLLAQLNFPFGKRLCRFNRGHISNYRALIWDCS